MDGKNTPANSIRVFGSAVMRVSPDTASIVVAVSQLYMKPKESFAAAQKGAVAVNTYLHESGIKEFGSSRITLASESNYASGQQRFVGYRAKISFNVILRDMNQVDTLLSGIIAAGANELTSVTFETTRLKELRAETRRRAVVAAREKAELYCQAAGVTVGNVIAIEDVSPEMITGRSEGHTYGEAAPVDDVGESSSIDPGAIIVGAAVNISYQILANV